MYRLAALLTGLALLIGYGQAQAGLIASAGFNDASGMHSDATPNSPYEFGKSVLGQGIGEPGWLGAWRGGWPTVTDSVAYEGDGSLLIHSGCNRILEYPQTGRFRIDHYMQFPLNGGLLMRRHLFDGGPSFERSVGPW